MSVWVSVRVCVGECERECGSVSLGECVCMSEWVNCVRARVCVCVWVSVREGVCVCV